MTDESTMEISQEDIVEFADWLQSKKDESQEKYHDGPRSENPRQTDIALGRVRAYRTAYRGFTDWWNEVEGEYDE